MDLILRCRRAQAVLSCHLSQPPDLVVALPLTSRREPIPPALISCSCWFLKLCGCDSLLHCRFAREFGMAVPLTRTTLDAAGLRRAAGQTRDAAAR